MRRFVLLLPWLMSACSYYDSSLLAAHHTTDAGDDEGLEPGQDVVQEVVQDVVQEETTIPQEAAIDTGEDIHPSDVGQDAICVSAQPPDPPSHGDGGEIDFVVAVHQVELGDTQGDAKTIGFDLDARCTCQGDGDSCFREAWATADSCDGPGGRDNAVGTLLPALDPKLTGFGSAVWSEEAVRGDWGLLLHVREYNGKEDDSQVRLDWLVPFHFSADKEGGTHPAWDGNDAWPIRDSCLIDSDVLKPRMRDLHAYVTKGTLVAILPESTLVVTNGFSLDLSGTLLTAKIVESPQGWQLQDGVLAARWKADAFLSQLDRMIVLGLNVCKDHPAYSTMKKRICAHVDIYSGVSSPTTPCNSVSMGMRFEAMPAKMGPVLPSSEQASACAPGKESAGDSCSQ